MKMQSHDDRFTRILQDFVCKPICEQTYHDLTDQIRLEEVIEALGDPATSQELSNLIFDALHKCIKLDSVQDELLSSEQLKPYLAGAASSRQAGVRQFVATMIKLSCKRTKGIQLLLASGNFSYCATFLFDDDLQVSELAKSAILMSLSNNEKACDAFFGSPIFDFVMKSLNECAEVVLVRVLSAFISIGRISKEIFEKCEQNGLYDRLLRMYFSDDLLMKIITIDLIHELSDFPAGVEFLTKGDIPSDFLRELRKSNVDNSIKVTILHFVSECVGKYPLLTQRLFEEDGKAFPETLQNLLSSEESIEEADKIRNFVCFASCWSSLSIHPIGREAVLREIPQANIKMAKLVDSSFGTEASRAAITAWRYLFANACDRQTRDVPALYKGCITSSALIDNYLFAIEVFFTSEKHLALLVDPISESVSAAFYAKYEFAKSAYTSHRCLIQRLAGNEYICRLEAYISGGPFYRPRGSDVAVDHASA
ncbi:hypothetical protein IE077_001927 [Cardiosporidium cionae]|uniref:26S proteasome non-ATPase regulatory subunit 5 n=1 Tax=Cardiosporidium cionae TaxID=476202 RepID=A0ABQ7JC43_9APIC|nr:hypothetical protein IE077_001927 [Cardiosporidium cionae]|eukprot:KAF8821536.1 hypothetical protein IE077_001927 [Cardiosporidium cionae]